MKIPAPFIDIKTFNALAIKEIADLIVPLSEVGRKCKEDFVPYRQGEELELRRYYERLKELWQSIEIDIAFRQGLTGYLSKIKNIESLIASLEKNSRQSSLEIDELFEIKYLVFYAEKIRALLKSKNLESSFNLPTLSPLLKELDPEELDAPLFRISGEFSEKLATLKEEQLAVYREKLGLIREKLKRAAKKIGVTSCHKQITVSRNNRELIDKINASEEFFVSAENFANITYSLRATDKILSLEQKENELKSSIEQEELLIRKRLTKTVCSFQNELATVLNELGSLDLALAKTIFAIENRCIIPEIIEENERNNPVIMSFQDAINLATKRELQSQKIEYQPIDICFDSRVNVLTGANMSGKSTVLDLLGQLLYLTSMAVPLPCEAASVTLVDFIYSNRLSETGDLSEKASGLSSFASEMVGLNEVLNRKGKGLFLLDELAKGTNPAEGEAITLALIGHFADNSNIDSGKPLVVAATHFSLPFLPKNVGCYQIKGIAENDYNKLKDTLSTDASDSDKELPERIHHLHKYMNYQLEKVTATNTPPQAAIMIAEILGFNKAIINKAKEHLNRNTL